MGSHVVCAQAGPLADAAVASKQSTLKCCCSNGQVLGSSLNAVGVLFCCLLLWTLYIPCLVRGESYTGQTHIQDKLSISSNVEGRSSAFTILNRFGRTKAQRDLSMGGDNQVLQGLPVMEDTRKQNGKSMPMSDNIGEGEPLQLRDLPISCSASRVTYTPSADLSPSNAALKQSSLSLSPLSTAPNVAIIPPVLEWDSHFLFTPSVRSLTIVNKWNDSGLFVFQPYSTNSDFYTTAFQETTVPPGGMMSVHVIFLPRKVGVVDGLLVIQTSAGGFVVQVQGEGLESPFHLQPLPGFNSTGETLLHSLKLYNPFDEPLLVEEVSVWIGDFRKRASHVSGPSEDRGRTVLCKRDNTAPDILWSPAGSPDWIQPIGVETCYEGEEDRVLRLRPAGQWEIEPHSSNAIVELEISANEEKGVQGALCIKVVDFTEDVQKNMILPLKVQPRETMSCLHRKVHAKTDLDFGILTHKGQEIKRDIVLVNPGPDYVLIEEIYPSCHDNNIVDIQYSENLVLQPKTEVLAATVTYIASEARTASTYCVADNAGSCAEFMLIVKINSTRDPYLEISYQAVVLDGTSNNCFFSNVLGHDSINEFVLATVLTQSICQSNQDFRIQEGFDVPFEVSSSGEKTFWTLKQDGALHQILKAKLSKEKFALEDPKLVFPVTLVGEKEMKNVSVANPSDMPMFMELLLSSEAGRSSRIDKEGVPIVRCGSDHARAVTGQDAIFSIAEGGVINLVLQPNGTGVLGPIVFTPTERRASTGIAILWNNLTGIEWMPVQGYGASAALTFLDGSHAVEILELNFNSTLLPPPVNKTIKEHIDDLFDDTVAKSMCHKRMSREFMAKNTGDLPLHVKSLMITGNGGGSHGFRVDSSHGFYLAPGQFTKMMISYQPDFTATVTLRDLQLTTSFGKLTVPLKANLPEQMPAFCQKALLVSKVKKLLLHVCLVALFLVLMVFVKMLKQERAAASDPSQWPSASSSTRLFQHLAIKTGQLWVKTGGEAIYYHDRERHKLLETPFFSVTNAFDSTTDLDRLFGNSNILSRAFSIVRVIVASLGNFGFTIKSFFLPENMEASPNFRVRISTMGTPVASLTRSNSILSKQSTSTASVSNRISEKKGNVTRPRNQSLKSGDQLSSSVYTSEGASTPISGVSSLDSLQKEIITQPVLLPSTHPTLDKVQPQSPRAGMFEKEKDKGKRKKRRNNISFMRQEVGTESRSRSSSPSSSPSSPATSNSSSRPASPFVRQGSLSNTSTGRRENHSRSEHTQELLSQINIDLNSRSQYLRTEMKRVDCLRMKDTQAGWTVSHESQSDVEKVGGFPVGDARCMGGVTMPVAKDLEAIDQREAGKDLDQTGRAVHVGNTIRSRAVLTTSATFPGRGQRSDINAPIMQERKLVMSNSISTPSLVSTSLIAPHARAPGSRLTKEFAENPPEKQGAASNCQVDVDTNVSNAGESCGVSKSLFEQTSNATDQKAGEFVYDIWGDHFAEISRRRTQSSWSFRESLLQNDFKRINFSFSPDSHSLFSKEFLVQGGTVDHVDDSILTSSTPGFSVFSAADPFLSLHPFEVLFGSRLSHLDQGRQ